MAKQKGKANDWKRIKQTRGKFATVGGEWEITRKPWMMIFLIGFKIKATDFAIDLHEGDDNDYRIALAEIFGLKALDREFGKIMPAGWDFLGSNYTFEHNPHQFTLSKQSDFQFALDAMFPPEFAKKDDKKGAAQAAERISKTLLNSKILMSGKEWEMKPLANVK